jgi:hypothetical protein
MTRSSPNPSLTEAKKPDCRGAAATKNIPNYLPNTFPKWAQCSAPSSGRPMQSCLGCCHDDSTICCSRIVVEKASNLASCRLQRCFEHRNRYLQLSGIAGSKTTVIQSPTRSLHLTRSELLFCNTQPLIKENFDPALVAARRVLRSSLSRCLSDLCAFIFACTTTSFQVRHLKLSLAMIVVTYLLTIVLNVTRLPQSMATG